MTGIIDDIRNLGVAIRWNNRTRPPVGNEVCDTWPPVEPAVGPFAGWSVRGEILASPSSDRYMLKAVVDFGSNLTTRACVVMLAPPWYAAWRSVESAQRAFASLIYNDASSFSRMRFNKASADNIHNPEEMRRFGRCAGLREWLQSELDAHLISGRRQPGRRR